MTIEEKAIEYILNTYYVKDLTEKEKIYIREEIAYNDKRKIKAFVAGFEEGSAESMKLIEKMKCCNNCKHYRVDLLQKGNYVYPCNKGGAKNCDMWDLKDD